MKGIVQGCSRVLGGTTFAALLIMAASGGASAQPVLSQRCAADTLSGAASEARVNWARRCALIYRVNNPAAWFDYGVPAANGGNLREYEEYDYNLNPMGQNSWIGPINSFEINTTTTSNIYLSGATSQYQDSSGYYRWERPANRKRLRPIHPIYGSHYDLYSASNVQLFPHPTNLNDCFFYLDKAGTVVAVGRAFYVSGFCEPSSFAIAQEQGVEEVDLEETSLVQRDELEQQNRILRYKMIPAELLP